MQARLNLLRAYALHKLILKKSADKKVIWG